MNIGEKIKELRVRRRMTQADLAGDTVSRNMVSLIENGRATPSVQTLEEIAYNDLIKGYTIVVEPAKDDNKTEDGKTDGQ